MHQKPRPLVVQIPLWLKAAVAGSVGLVMVVFFEVGYSLGSQNRKETETVARIDPPKKPEPASAAKELTPPKPVAKIEPAKPKKPEPAAADTFAKVIQPIFRSRCLACHGDPAIKGGLDLRTAASIRKGGNSGSGIVPGNLNDSQIWRSIDDGSMPPSGKTPLTSAEVAAIQKWILSAK